MKTEIEELEQALYGLHDKLMNETIELSDALKVLNDNIWDLL